MTELHRCHDGCVCPIHRTPLLYAPAHDQHACQDPKCVHAHGIVGPSPEEVRSVFADIQAKVYAPAIQADPTLGPHYQRMVTMGLIAYPLMRTPRLLVAPAD